MKELSIEQKAQRYDEAIEIAREINNEQQAQPFNVMTRVFPELKESECERIRKAILELVRQSSEILEKKNQEQMLAWLEKQGEQKPADKVEPKFKVGDWIVSGFHSFWHIDKISDGRYYVSSPNNIYDDFAFCDEYLYHIFTIQDAKDGDVIYLPNGNNEYYFFIFKGIKNAAVMSFAHFYQYNDGTYKVEGTIDKLSSVNDVFKPTTKEQRDLLFQKMKEAGYEWDAEKKELKKIEQEPTKNEELTEFDKAVGVSIGTWNPKTPEQIQSVKSLSNKLLKLAKKQINNEQKPAWSEEDERNLEGIIDEIQANKSQAPDYDLETYDRFLSWLKSIKDRYTWKPSDEQMNALDSTLQYSQVSHNSYEHLNSLFNDLKKLMEE